MPNESLNLSLEELKELFPIQSDLIDYLILTFLLQKNEPTGSWTFKEMFEQAGLTVGTATIGRNLKMMDSHGYTVQVANKGRVLTDLGLEKASHLRAHAAEQEFSRDLMALTKSTDMKTLADILYARIAIEYEAARLAALNAGPGDLEELQWSLNQHKRSISLGNSSAGTGLDFHLVLAKASQNQAMYTALNLLIYQQRCIEWNAQAEGILEYSTTYDAIHKEILNAVRQHDPQLAAHLIKSHLLDIIHEIEKNTGTV